MYIYTQYIDYNVMKIFQVNISRIIKDMGLHIRKNIV